MKTLRAFVVAAAIAAVIALATGVIPTLSQPVLFSYVVVVLLVTAHYDYTRGRPGRRLF